MFYQCGTMGCEMQFRTERERDYHEMHTWHCPECGDAPGEEWSAMPDSALCPICEFSKRGLFGRDYDRD